MPIVTGEFAVYRAVTNDQTGSNGGRIDDSNQSISGVDGNVWPSISTAQLTSGITIQRKLGVRVENGDNLTLQDGAIYLAEILASSPIEQYIRKADATDTQASPFSTAKYGIGTLDTSISAADTSLDVAVKDGTVTQFYDGGRIYIEGGGNTEIVTISGTPSVAADVVTLTLESTGVANAYTAGAVVAAVLDFGDIATSVTGVTVTSASGTFDEAQMTVSHVGAIHQTVTLTFTSATAFDAVSDVAGSQGSGNVGSTFAPTNPNKGVAWYSIPAAAWGGTFANGDTVELTTEPAMMFWWEDLIVPAGTPSASGLTVEPEFNGSSA